MGQVEDTTLHIKIKKQIADGLKELAKRKGRSVSDLVREAISSTYQPENLDIPIEQKRAIEAYRGGYISIGKLSEIIGKSLYEMRFWLSEHDIAENNAFNRDDIKHAE
jgi:predicted HTH domain antitoxin